MKTITGPGGTVYTVIAVLGEAIIGIADLGNGSYRVRVVPTNGAELDFPSGWTTPSSNNNRFSTVVSGVEGMAAAVAVAAAIAGGGSADAPVSTVMIEVGGDEFELDRDEAAALHSQLSAFLAAA
jgi:hypothetical protein